MGHCGRANCVSGLLGLEQPEEHIDAWQRAWDEISDPDLEGEGDDELADAEAGLQRNSSQGGK